MIVKLYDCVIVFWHV